jgi:subtilisin family serine protease
MRHRSSSVLKGCLATVVLIAVLITVPAATSQQSVESAIIKVKSRADALAIANRYDVTVIDSIPEVNKYLVKGTSSNLNLLRRDPNVQSVEYDIATEISETVILNESTAALLDPNNVALLLDGGQTWDGHHWVKSSVFRQPALQKIQFEATTLAEDAIIVAVIDTGIDPLHETLIGSTLPGRNFIDERQSTDEMKDLDPTTAALLQQRNLLPANAQTLAILNPSAIALLPPGVVAAMKQTPTPYFGHGTMVSGLIHAIAPSALIMPLKVFDATGRGTSFRIAKAIVYAVNQGASVINMSFGLEAYSDLVDDAVDYATRSEVVLVASIGNRNSKVDKIYPAADHKVVGVAATDLQDQKAIFSNYGPAADVAAPGEGLISPYPAGLYAIWSGTSASAALVSGEAALLFSRSNWKANEVAKRVGDRVDPLHAKYDLGKGRINLKDALKK